MLRWLTSPERLIRLHSGREGNDRSQSLRVTTTVQESNLFVLATIFAVQGSWFPVSLVSRGNVRNEKGRVKFRV